MTAVWGNRLVNTEKFVYPGTIPTIRKIENKGGKSRRNINTPVSGIGSK